MTRPVDNLVSRNEWGRLADIVLHPVKAFDDIRVQPTWIAPALVLSLLATIHAIALAYFVGIEQAYRNQLDIIPSDYQKIETMDMLFEPSISYPSTIIQYPLAITVNAILLFGLFRWLVRSSLRFSESMSIVSYSYFPYAISTVLTILFIPIKDPSGVDLNVTLGLNSSVILEALNAPKFLIEFSSYIDAIWVWSLVLQAVGVTVLTQTIRLRTSILAISLYECSLLALLTWIGLD